MSDLANAKVIPLSSIISLFDTLVTVTYEPGISQVISLADHTPCHTHSSVAVGLVRIRSPLLVAVGRRGTTEQETSGAGQIVIVNKRIHEVHVGRITK